MKKLLKFTYALGMLCSTSFAAELPELQVPMEQMALTQQQVQPSPFVQLPTDLISYTITFTGSYDLAFVNKECLKAALPVATRDYAHAIIHHQQAPEEVMAILRRAHQVLDNTAPNIEDQITEQRQQLTDMIIKQIVSLSGGSFYRTSLPPFISGAFESSLDVFQEYPVPVVLDILKGNNYVAKECVDEIKRRIATKAPAYISLNNALQGGITEQHTHVFANYEDVPFNNALNNLFAARQDLTLVIDFDNLTQTPNSYGFDLPNWTPTISPSIQRISITGAKLKVLGNHFLASCTNLATLTLPNCLTSVGDSFLGVCFRLTAFTLPDSLTSVGDCFLFGCISITSLTLPNNLRAVTKIFLRDCNSLTTVNTTQEVWNRISPQLSAADRARLIPLIRIV